jgi:cold shock CspA family protein
MEAVMLGRMKMYNADEGYGFVSLRHPLGSISEVFVHISNAHGEDYLEPGWLIEFKLDQNRRYPDKVVATDVRVLDKSPLIEIPLGDLQVILNMVDDVGDLDPEEVRAKRALLDVVEAFLRGNYPSGLTQKPGGADQDQEENPSVSA